MSNKSLPPANRCAMPYTAEAVAAEMRGHVSNILAFARPEDNRKSAIAFAARVLGLPFNRVRDIYYGNARLIGAHEADRIRAYVQAASKLMEARRRYEEAREDFVAAAPRLARLAPAGVGDVAVPPDRAAAQPRRVKGRAA